MATANKHMYFKSFKALATGFWNIRQRPKICMILGVVIAFNIISVYLTVLLNDWYNSFWNVIQNYQFDQFWAQVGRFSWIAGLYIAIGVYSVYLRQLIQIEWRKWMTEKYLGNWLNQRAYYKLKLLGQDLDNPDQRISEDINQFVGMTLDLTLGLLSKLMTLVAFVVVLWNLSGIMYIPLSHTQIPIYGYMVWLSLIYSIVGTYLTHLVGRRLIRLNYDQQCYEADFRFSMMRMRENSESIAFYRGEEPELSGFKQRFTQVVTNFRQIMFQQKLLNAFTVGYGQLAIIIPILLIAPRWFGERVEIGWIMQVLNAFGQVQGAMSYFVDAYAQLAQWFSVIQRLYGFHQHLLEVGDLKSELEFVRSDGELAVKDLSVHLPDNSCLLKNADFSLSDKDSVLIMGPSGVGKSTLLRTLAGIWPYAEGTVITPGAEKILFLPQRPYLPLGALREAIFYPKLVDCSRDDEVKQALSRCGLARLTTQLDRVDDWSRILSLGEQQRLAFIRILLYAPEYVFLDEATSALDEASEDFIYQLLKTELPRLKVISVGHRSTLIDKHRYKLTLLGNQQWRLSEL